MKILIACAIVFMTTVCNADTRYQFYSNTGRPAGSATSRQFGNSTQTRFYGNTGRPTGSSITRGRNTTVYGNTGRPLGVVRRR